MIENQDIFIKSALRRKVMDPVVLDVRNLTSIADLFIIVSAHSNRQVMAVAELIQVDLKKINIKPLSVEGKQGGQWILLDYGHVIIHIFYDSVRRFYDLEGLWVDAPRIEVYNE